MGSTASVSPSTSDLSAKDATAGFPSHRSSTLLTSPSASSSNGSAQSYQNFDKVREAFDVLQFQNIDVDRSTPAAYNKWARAEHVLKQDPKLMVSLYKCELCNDAPVLRRAQLFNIR